jgi:hypothetical protein
VIDCNNARCKPEINILCKFVRLLQTQYECLFVYFFPVALYLKTGLARLFSGLQITFNLETHIHTLIRSPLEEGSAVAEITTWQNTAIKRDRIPCLQSDSNPLFQQVCSHPIGSVCYRITLYKCSYHLSACHIVPTNKTLNAKHKVFEKHTV